MLSASSFAPSLKPVKGTSRSAAAPLASAFLFPSFRYVPSIPISTPEFEDFLKAFMLPTKLHSSHDTLTAGAENDLVRVPQLQDSFTSRKVDEILILICSHGGRDSRCGILGPLLKAEFEDKLSQQGITCSKDTPTSDVPGDAKLKSQVRSVRVGLISHIGGHKWAGNVIVYLPPSLTGNALAGKGIWYGRVGPEHVEGIVAKTVVEGTVIKDLFRGGIDEKREAIRL